MKNVIITKISYLILGISFQLSGQDANEKMIHEIGIQAGLSFTTYKESRLSNQNKTYTLPKFALTYSKWNSRRRETLIVSYKGSFGKTGVERLRYKVIHPEVIYAYERSVNDIWVGGYFHSSSIINFPQSATGLFGNNPASYTINHGLGLTLGNNFSLIESSNKTISFDASSRIALLNYLIRPAYGHPYPEDYLKEENFHPTRKGMAASMVKSGKLKSINKYQSIQISIGLNYIYRDNLKLNLRYTFDLQANQTGHKSSSLANDLMLGVSYIY